MNIVRTKAVELSCIPAIAYKMRLAAGGAGVKILRLDKDETAVASIDKRTGEAAPYGAFDEDLFPYEAFEEAIDLTVGLPYSSRGKIKITVFEQLEADEVGDEPSATIDMLESEEYKAIVERYSDEKGKLNYQLLNKDFIQFAAKSKTVGDMIANQADNEDILLFVVKSRAALIAGKKESLGDAETKALIDTLDEIDPRSAFKELKAHINRMLARKRPR